MFTYTDSSQQTADASRYTMYTITLQCHIYTHYCLYYCYERLDCLLASSCLFGSHQVGRCSKHRIQRLELLGCEPDELVVLPLVLMCTAKLLYRLANRSLRGARKYIYQHAIGGRQEKCITERTSIGLVSWPCDASSASRSGSHAGTS